MQPKGCRHTNPFIILTLTPIVCANVLVNTAPPLELQQRRLVVCGDAANTVLFNCRQHAGHVAGPRFEAALVMKVCQRHASPFTIYNVTKPLLIRIILNKTAPCLIIICRQFWLWFWLWFCYAASTGLSSASSCFS